jgi:hypothetical protein
MNFRSLSLCRIVPALALAAGAAALDNDQVNHPFISGGDQYPPYIEADVALKSKLLDLGLAVHDDVVLGASVQGRVMGIGGKLDLDFAIGQAPDVSRPGERTTPLETLRESITLDWAIEIRDPRNAKAPLVQIIPRFRHVSYPNQKDNVLKNYQNYLGVEAWYMLPWEGVEVGASVERGLAKDHFAAYHWEFGAREFLQTSSADFAFWQKIDAGNKAYREAVVNGDGSGLNTLDLGTKATLPLPWKEWYSFVSFEISYWLGKDDRDQLSDNGQDNGNAVLAVGVRWIPD